MVLKEGKKKKLVELLAKRRAVVAGVGTSTLATPPSSTTSAPNSYEPTPVDKRKGWWWRLAQRTRTPTRASFSIDKGWMMSWRLRTLLLAATPHPLGTILLAPPPLVTLSCTKARGECS